jgi:hypothetical protein
MLRRSSVRYEHGYVIFRRKRTKEDREAEARAIARYHPLMVAHFKRLMRKSGA